MRDTYRLLRFDDLICFSMGALSCCCDILLGCGVSFPLPIFSNRSSKTKRDLQEAGRFLVFSDRGSRVTRIDKME